MIENQFSGCPPKSSAHIGYVLKSIHKANGPLTHGPCMAGLSSLERKTIHASALRSGDDVVSDGAAASRSHSPPDGALAGGYVGLLLGLNIGFALAIRLQVASLLSLVFLVPPLCGCVVGIILGRKHVMPLQGETHSILHTQGGASRLRRGALPWAGMWVPHRGEKHNSARPAGAR